MASIFRQKSAREQVVVSHRLAWLWEPLEDRPTFLLRPMFGSKAVYLHGRMMMCFFTKAEPWSGMLLCTEREHHPSLMKDFPALMPHPVLGKWLYLPEAHDDFESIAERIVRLAGQHDPRVGIVPAEKKKKK